MSTPILRADTIRAGADTIPLSATSPHLRGNRLARTPTTKKRNPPAPAATSCNGAAVYLDRPWHAKTAAGQRTVQR